MGTVLVQQQRQSYAEVKHAVIHSEYSPESVDVHFYPANVHAQFFSDRLVGQAIHQTFPDSQFGGAQGGQVLHLYS